MTIFICHVEHDARAARSLQTALSDYGYLVVSTDADLKIGDEWQESILENIEAAKVVLVLWSHESSRSEFLFKEAELADATALNALHIRLGSGVPVPSPFSHREQHFFTPSSPEPGEFEAILTHIVDTIGHPPPLTTPAEHVQGLVDDDSNSSPLIKSGQRQIINTAHHPFAGRIAAPDWASGWGEDEHGVFVEITVEEVTQALRWCPPGRFLMGSPEGETERLEWEGPQISITFERGFWLFETPVTQALYEAVTGDTPSRFEGLYRPAEQVSWDDAKIFLDRINDHIPGLDLSLPSEAQWEYACRAGSTTPFEPIVARTHAGASITPAEVNYDGNFPYGAAAKGDYREKTLPVKSRGFRPNAWGLWQMHGNVWEWCENAWQGSHDGAAPDGSPRPASKQSGGTFRVVRGGSWSDDARGCRSACRRLGQSDYRDDYLGFRPARGQASGAQAGSGGAAGVFYPEGAR